LLYIAASVERDSEIHAHQIGLLEIGPTFPPHGYRDGAV
jgi:hypothetical protein